MLSARVRAPALALIVSALASACGDDGDSTADGGGEADAGPDAAPDSGPPDDVCPGMLLFEAQVADAVSDAEAFEVEVVEVGGSASTQSAPNGRAQLCLPAGADAQVRSTKDDNLDRLDTLSADALEIASAAAQPYPLDVLEAAVADSLLMDLAGDRDVAASQLLVSVVSYPDAEPLVGATVTIDKDSDGAFARNASLEFGAAGDDDGVVADGRVLLFANVGLDGSGEPGQAAITVAPPDGFEGTCVGPPTVELEAGGLSGAFFACQ